MHLIVISLVFLESVQRKVTLLMHRVSTNKIIPLCASTSSSGISTVHNYSLWHNPWIIVFIWLSLKVFSESFRSSQDNFPKQLSRPRNSGSMTDETPHWYLLFGVLVTKKVRYFFCVCFCAFFLPIWLTLGCLGFGQTRHCTSAIVAFGRKLASFMMCVGSTLAMFLPAQICETSCSASCFFKWWHGKQWEAMG